MVGIAIPTQSCDRHCWFYSKPTAVFLLQLFEGERLCVGRRHRFSVFTPFHSRTFSTAVLCRRASSFGGFIDFRSCLLSGSTAFSLNSNTFTNRILCRRVKAGHRSTLRSSVFDFWHRASVYVRLSAHLRRVLKSTCVCLRLREQCLRSEITSVSRVANVLLLRFVAGNMDLNTLASKRSQLIGNTAIVRKRCVIHKKSTCVCLRLSVAAFTRKSMDARFDLWPALGNSTTLVCFDMIGSALSLFSCDESNDGVC